ncbi:ABC transporter permease [Nocardioides sp. MAHUQ-72]|uniref:ABC transporter permease n=1 Tax=unclassified Nocardioides TaxID=2615069 RepID=UPI00362356F9
MSSPSDFTGAADPAPAAAPAAVIHDLGYRSYTGPRLGEREVAWALLVTGLRNCFGLGRSGRSKVLPMILLGLMLLPALILVGVLVQAKGLLGLDEQIVAYSIYPLTTQLLISVFVASQAPALVSRDLRFRTITLYLARPLRRTTYVLVRLASLTAATFVLIGAPLLLMYLGGLLAELPPGRETGRVLGALVGALLLAACLSGLAALVSALTIRRGLAVAAVIVVLLVSYTVVATIQGISLEAHHPRVGEVAGMFSPYTLVNGVQVFLFDSPEATPTPPTGTGMGLLYLLVTALVVLGSVGAMLRRYREVPV